MRDYLTVGSANLHNDRGPTRWILNRPGLCDVVCVYEAQRQTKRLRRSVNYRLHTGKREKGRNMPQSTGILVRKRMEDRGGSSVWLSKEWKPASRVAPDRWAQTIYSEFKGKPLLVIAVHPNAGPELLRGSDPEHPLVKRHWDVTRWACKTAFTHHRMGWHVVVAGDVQLPASVDRPWNLNTQMKRVGFGVHSVHIDSIFWSPGLSLKDAAHYDIGSDHPMLRTVLS